MKKTALLTITIVLGLTVAVGLIKAMDMRRSMTTTEFGDESLYVNPKTARRLSLGFNGLAADWHWMRSLQYVGGKIVAFDDTHKDKDLILGDLDLHLLPSLLRVSTALDPQFMAPYEYGAMILPEFNSDDAISLLDTGIAANPTKWRLYQHLGYIYWQRHDYHKASEIYSAGANLPGAPAWMAAIGARMQAEGGSRAAAREMYQHLYESSSDQAVKDMVVKQLLRLDSLDDRENIQRILREFSSRNGRCASSWREVTQDLRAARMRVDPATGAPLDPSNTPYRLMEKECSVDLGEQSKVSRR
jgi:tetratricopeptide (TPR) repeat protein